MLVLTMSFAQIFLRNAEIIGGVAYLRKENVVVVGGEVLPLQLAHRRRLYDELITRLHGDLMDAAVSPVWYLQMHCTLS